MKTPSLLLAAGALLFGALPAWAQEAPRRLPAQFFDVTPPSARVEGPLSQMGVVRRECRAAPGPDLRRRIVDIAIQEWAFFGFPVLDRLNGARLLPGTGVAPGRVVFENTTRRAPTPTAFEGERVAASIAGYWAVTPEGAGIVRQQTRRWEEQGAGVRWNAPWSAAFISWVMCEAGLGTNDRFRRAIAHWTYVDQAILARDGQEGNSGYVAYDVGERTVEPGDMLCSARRPVYRTLADRRRQMGLGASSHCDIVVEVDVERERILAIGGNVLRAVSLKVLPGQRSPDGGVVARRDSGVPIFAHLKLRAESIGIRALADSHVLAAFVRGDDGTPPNGGPTAPPSRVFPSGSPPDGLTQPAPTTADATAAVARPRAPSAASRPSSTRAAAVLAALGVAGPWSVSEDRE